MRSPIFISLGILVVVAACDVGPQSPAAPDVNETQATRGEEPAPLTPDALENVEGLEGGFFAGDEVFDDAVELGDDFSVVPCAGATPDETHDEANPQLLRGQLVAPHGKLARNVFPEWLVASAHAVPVGGERTVAGITIRLVDVRDDKTLGDAKTDALGRFCIRIPDGVQRGFDLWLVAEREGTSLRRFVLPGLDANLSVSTEALHRLLLAKKDSPELSVARAINLFTLADTALDLLEPVELSDTATTESAVGEVTAHLQSDPRFSAKYNAL